MATATINNPANFPDVRHVDEMRVSTVSQSHLNLIPNRDTSVVEVDKLENGTTLRHHLVTDPRLRWAIKNYAVVAKREGLASVTDEPVNEWLDKAETEIETRLRGLVYDYIREALYKAGVNSLDEVNRIALELMQYEFDGIPESPRLPDKAVCDMDVDDLLPVVHRLHDHSRNLSISNEYGAYICFEGFDAAIKAVIRTAVLHGLSDALGGSRKEDEELAAIDEATHHEAYDVLDHVMRTHAVIGIAQALECVGVTDNELVLKIAAYTICGGDKPIVPTLVPAKEVCHAKAA